MFDNASVLFTFFSGDSEVVDREWRTEPAVVELVGSAFETVWQRATPHEEYKPIIWDAIETALTAWQDAGEPDISAVRLEVGPEAHTYWIGGRRIATAARSYWIGETPALRWRHRHQPLSG
jgi:ribosomal protein L31